MLAYELYYENKDSNTERGRAHPIKKIFVKNNVIKIDTTPIDIVGRSENLDNAKSSLQKILDMPIDTNPNINLPSKMVSSNSPKPYVIIPGIAKLFNKKGSDSVAGEITLGNKTKGSYAKLSLPSYDEEILSADTSLKMNKTDYLIDGEPLYDMYVKNQIIQDDKLLAPLFEKIAKEFFKFVKDKQVEFKGKTTFMLYILPNDKKINYQDKNKGVAGTSFTDSFGNEGELPDKPTDGVFFLSYDDPAFSINCKQKQEFYKDIGISEKSRSKIRLPENKMMSIAGFNWYFTDLENPGQVFARHNKGIYRQLFENYTKLKTSEEKTNLSHKVFCIKKTNAKLEVMVDENLTMQRLKSIFKNVQNSEIPNNAYESLIIRRGRSKIFSHYIRAVKSLLSQTGFSRDQLVSIFTRQIHDEIRGWLKERTGNNANEFFNKAEFCIKTLNHVQRLDGQLNSRENFAKSVGRMTRTYVDFRKRTKNDNNSIKDLLSKPKYDVGILKSVIKSIGRGIHLLNINKDEYDFIVKKMTELAPKDDVENTHDDLSYHFYMGYFGESA